MKVLSLFSGAGGADLALEAAGFSVAALCEIEPHARAVLREHWSDVPLHGDVQTLDGTQYRGKVDVVVGGSPCQDLSIAGKRAGLMEGSGTRSALFHDQVRVWNESGATYLIWENVKGAFSSSKGADFAAVLSAIVGCDVAVPANGKWTKAGVVAGPTAVAAWRLLDLQHFGVPQRRERIVVLAARAGGVDPAEVLALGQSLSRDSAPRFQARERPAADAVGGVGGAVHAIDAEHNPANNGVLGTLNIGSSSGGGHQPVTVAFAQNQIGEVRVSDTMGTLNTNSNASGRATPMVLAVNISDGRATLDDTMGTLGARSGGQEVGAQTRGVVLAFHPTQDPISGDISPALGVTSGGMGVVEPAPPRTLAFKIRGGVEVDANGNSAGKGYLGSEELAFTIGTAQDQHIHQPSFRMVAFGEYAEDGTASAIKARDFKDATDRSVAHGVPRRLMPIECERLMGWPDDHTRFGVNEKGVRYELADTPRYKLCGNGIGREWMEWIGLRLMAAENTGVGEMECAA